MLDDLTADESDLVACSRAGEVLTRDAPIRADLIRELLLGRRGELDPRGVRPPASERPVTCFSTP
jgi:hypothetical protein